MSFYADYLFAPLLDAILSTRTINESRAKVVAQASGRVLEIGFGTGLNLRFYRPEVTQLTLLDNAVLLPKRVERRMAKCKADSVERVILSAEKLPFASGSFDFVVSTFTLCTIPDASAALAEVRRVLAPGGRFLFLEHGRSRSRLRARWQDWLNPLQRVCGVGCNLNRPIDNLIAGSGLKLTDLDCTPIAGMPPPLLMEIYRGSARGT